MTEKQREELFHEAVIPYGGRLDEADQVLGHEILGPLRQACQGWVDAQSGDPRVVAVGPMPMVHVDFVDDPRLNAFAFEHGGMYFIGICYGTVILLKAVFNLLLSHPDILPDIGDSSRESSQIALGQMPAGWDGLLGVASTRGIALEPPKDITREKYAHTLFEQAMLFLVGHELAHLRNGHVALANRWLGSSFILEVGGTAERDWTPLMNQAIEMDADAWGTCKSVASIVFGPDRGDRALYARQYAVAIHILFRLLGYVRLTSEEMREQFYPPPNFRAFWNASVFRELILVNHGEDSANKSAQVVADARVEAEIALSKMVGQAPDFDMFAETYTPEGLAHLDVVLKAWREDVRPYVADLAHANDLPL